MALHFSRDEFESRRRQGCAALAELHHRALAEGALDLPDRRIERALPVARVALACVLPPRILPQ